MLAGTLANELATLKGPTRLLVLDNFQDVSGNRALLAFTDTLIRYLPATVRLTRGRDIEAACGQLAATRS